MANTICWIQYTKRNRSRKKKGDKDGSVVQVNEQCCKWKNIRNRVDVKFVNNKPSYMSHKIFVNDLVAIRKYKVTLTLNKPANIEMCILKLSKVLMYEFDYGYV